ncbi:hypothetical protein XCR1_2190002 [Xenorhabdus cabanillasii JM26]|uniref:Uncharacterized protein n=1 Tax=Xenorhabdus cabanillasii JM26 TaxID=1427517 RepID=W1J5S2_9GAMM|nr:hypothetical protein XCR1_2190002 [Xenorhabdus cabanillasii JM26]
MLTLSAMLRLACINLMKDKNVKKIFTILQGVMRLLYIFMNVLLECV